MGQGKKGAGLSRREALFRWALERETQAVASGRWVRASLLWGVVAATDRVREEDSLDMKAQVQWEHLAALKFWTAWTACGCAATTYAIDRLAFHANWQSVPSLVCHALAVAVLVLLTAFSGWMASVIPSYKREENYRGRAAEVLRQRETARRRTEEARHAETRQMQQMVLDWWEAHKDEPGMTKDRAAEQMAESLVPLKFRTIREYLKGR